MKKVMLIALLLTGSAASAQVLGVEKYQKWYNTETIIHGLKGYVFEKENRHHKMYWYAEGRTQSSIEKVKAEVERILAQNGKLYIEPDVMDIEGVEHMDISSVDDIMQEVIFEHKQFSLTWLVPDQHEIVKQDWMVVFYVDDEGAEMYIRSSYDPFYTASNE